MQAATLLNPLIFFNDAQAQEMRSVKSAGKLLDPQRILGGNLGRQRECKSNKLEKRKKTQKQRFDYVIKTKKKLL